MEEFAISLKDLREQEGLTQEEFAKDLNVSINTYRTWEARGTNHRTPTVKKLIKIANLLNVSLDKLVGR